MGAVTANGNGSEITGVLTCLPHTFLAVISNNKTGNRALFTCRRDNLNHVIAVLIAGAFAFCKADSLPDDFSLFINAAAELCFGAWNQLKRNLVSFLLKLTRKGQFCHFVQNIILDFQQRLIIGSHVFSS